MEIISILKNLVKFQTIESNLEERIKCIHWIDDFLKKRINQLKILKFSVNKHPSRLYFLNNDKKFNLILNGHIDVVDGEKEQFQLNLKNNLAYGRGTYDMKGAIATYLNLFLSDYQLLKEKKVALMIVSDEEFSGEYGTKYILDYLYKKKYKIDFCINGEPTDLEIVKEARGGIFLKLEITGKSAHSAKPWLGKNPIHDFVKLINILNQYFSKLTKQKWSSSAELTEVKSVGFGLNTIPEKIITSIDIRYIPKDEIKIKKLLKYIKIKKIKILEKFQYNPIFYKNNSIYNSIIKKIIIKNGLKFKIRKGYGTSDLRYFSDRKIPGIGFGIIGGGAHSNNEFIDIESLEVYKKILIDFIKNI